MESVNLSEAMFFPFVFTSEAYLLFNYDQVLSIRSICIFALGLSSGLLIFCRECRVWSRKRDGEMEKKDSGVEG